MNVFVPSSRIHFFQLFVKFEFDFASFYCLAFNQVEFLPHKIMNLFSLLLIYQLLFNDNLPRWHFLSTLQLIVQLLNLFCRFFSNSFLNFFSKFLVDLEIRFIGNSRYIFNRWFFSQCDKLLIFINLINNEVRDKIFSDGRNLFSRRDELRNANT